MEVARRELGWVSGMHGMGACRGVARSHRAGSGGRTTCGLKPSPSAHAT